MKFTTEEIALCKKVAEKHRKEITRGDWVQDENNEIRLTERIQGEIIAMGNNNAIRFLSQHNVDLTPLWQISDCLELLRERGFNIQLEYYASTWWAKIHKPSLSYYLHSQKKQGKTPLEALLKAVLAILEES